MPIGLRAAIVVVTPVYAVGGLAMLAAARHYPSDVAFVVAEGRGGDPPDMSST